MKIDYAKLDDVNGEVTIAVEENDYAGEVKKQLKEIGKTHPEPGFRAGHVPTGILEKKYGKSVKYDVISKAVGEALYKYIQENKLPVLGQPVPDKANDLNPEGKEFTLKFKLGLAPELDLKADKDLKVPYYKIEISEDMIKQEDEHLRGRFGKQVPGEEVDETALVKGVITELNEDGTVKEGGVVVENGIVAPHYFKTQEQKEKFLGKKVGDEVVFNPWATCDGNQMEMASMLNVDKEDVANHQGDFKFDIKEIIVLKPAEQGEEFYKEAFGEAGNVKDEATYREALKKMIESQMAGVESRRFADESRAVILEKVKDAKLPDEVLKEFLLINDKNVTKENVDEYYASMRNAILWDIAQDQIARQLGVEVTEEDLKTTARMLALQQFMQYGMSNPPEEGLNRLAGDILKDEKSLRQVRNYTEEMKFFGALKDNVTLEEKTVTADEFSKLPEEDKAE